MIGNRPDGWVGIEEIGCLTGLGDETRTAESLLQGKVVLRLLPALGDGAGDPVPLALCRDWTETQPPRWYPEIRELGARIPDAPWGNPGFPVFVSSSNFGVGSMLAYRRTGDPAHLDHATPSDCVDRIAALFHWGPDRTVLSHACVSAHLALEQARLALLGGAKKALVFSFDFLSPFVAGGFHALKILNQGFPAPYEVRPEGSIGLGDGAAFAVLTPGSAPYRLSPASLANEMWHFTGNNPDGSGYRSIGDWLRSAAAPARPWIKGHGTGTLEAGRLEAESLQTLLPDSPLVSWKGSIGHTLGSCGLVEAAIAVASLRLGTIPGTVGTTSTCFSPNVATRPFDPEPYDGVLLLANAFGGAHAAAFLCHEN